MNEIYERCGQMTSEDSNKSTFSQVSEDGRAPSNSPDGETNAHAGPVRSRASRSAIPEIEEEQLILDISGLSCCGSYESAALSASLGSRCRELCGSVGSMEYQQIWKLRITPLGRLYWEHTAQEHRTSEIVSGGELAGWGTPRASITTGSTKRARNPQSRLEDQVFLKDLLMGSSEELALNPAMSRWLMGYPRSWDHAAPPKLQAERGCYGATETP